MHYQSYQYELKDLVAIWDIKQFLGLENFYNQ